MGPARVAARASRAVARRVLAAPLRVRSAGKPSTLRGRTGVRRGALAIRAAVGEGQGGLEMVTLKAGDQVAEVTPSSPLPFPVSRQMTYYSRDRLTSLGRRQRLGHICATPRSSITITLSMYQSILFPSFDISKPLDHCLFSRELRRGERFVETRRRGH
jgi:hypothetical protein